MLDVSCTHCGHSFRVEKSRLGGYASCPECDKATPVGGNTLSDKFFWMCVSAGGLVWLIAVTVPLVAGEWIAASVIFVLGALVWLGVYLAS